MLALPTIVVFSVLIYLASVVQHSAYSKNTDRYVEASQICFVCVRIREQFMTTFVNMFCL